MNSKLNSAIFASIITSIMVVGSSSVFEQVLAQEGAITLEDFVNETMPGVNATTSNATLAYAQEGFTTKDLINETKEMANATTSNTTLIQ